jgi:hypothetical protein
MNDTSYICGNKVSVGLQSFFKFVWISDAATCKPGSEVLYARKKASWPAVSNPHIFSCVGTSDSAELKFIPLLTHSGSQK